jgi:hypothetical protein
MEAPAGCQCGKLRWYNDIYIEDFSSSVIIILSHPWYNKACCPTENVREEHSQEWLCHKEGWRRVQLVSAILLCYEKYLTMPTKMA